LWGVKVAQPRSLDEALAALASMPDAQLLAGGTDFMVEVNFGHRRPTAIVGLRRVQDLKGYAVDDRELVLRAGLTYREMEHERELIQAVPVLAEAARTVGSPQIRNAGTLGGNLGTASPAGDTLPVLAALNATVVLTSSSGERCLSLADFVTGPKRTALRPDEILREVRIPRVRGPQEFLKVGTRTAMVIAVANCALVFDLDERGVRCGLGSVGPVPIRALAAEAFIAAEIDWDRRSASPTAISQFGELVAAAARPITDHRSTAEYRRHAVKVIAGRALERCLAAYGG
jgi:CO/xanthine dehydrogenase FAD-binding subunit